MLPLADLVRTGHFLVLLQAGMAGSNGYPLEWFAKPVADRFKCGICKQVIRDPAVTPCGHIYCAQCISSWAKHYGVCPERCREVETNSLSCPLNEMGKFISGLAVYCKNRPAGCRVQIKLAEKNQHEQVCSYSRPKRVGLGKLLPKFSLSQQDLRLASPLLQDRGFKQQRTESTSGLQIHTLPRRSPSTASSAVSSVHRPAGHCAMPVAMVSNQHLASYSFLTLSLIC